MDLEDLEAKLEQTRRDVTQYYTRLINTLEKRKQVMVDSLDTLKIWIQRIRQKTDLLEQAKTRTNGNMTIPVAARQTAVIEFQTEIDRLKTLVTSQTFEFEWDTNRETEASNIGLMVLVHNHEERVDIMSLRMLQTFQVQSFCERWKNDGELEIPEGVTVEPLNDWIIIANCGNDSIDIFSKEGNFLNRFGEELDGPNGITTFNEEIYVSNIYSHCITVHSFIGGRVERRVGRMGKGDLEFSSPEGISIVAKEDGCLLYVADRDNNRVKVLNGELRFQRHIGKEGIQRSRA